MTTAGLLYPNDKNYLANIRDRGYFIHVDRAAANITLLAGGEINSLISDNKQLFFIFGVTEDVPPEVHIAGFRQDIIDALYFSGYSIEIITKLLSTGISIDNINTAASQQWISIFKDRNTGKTPPCHTENLSQIKDNIDVKKIQALKVDKPIIQKPCQTEIPPNLTYPVTSKYTVQHIEYTRHLIHDSVTATHLGNNPNFEVPPEILQYLFEMYDNLFFGSKLSTHMKEHKIHLTFSYSTKMTRIAGYCKIKDQSYEIKLSQPIMSNTFRNGENMHMSNGLKCYDRLDCLMNVFEHELIHFVIGIINCKDGKSGHIKGDPIYKSHGVYFQQLMKAYFGHTEFTHRLHEDGNKHMGKRNDFVLGQYVTYKSKDGSKVFGKIDKLNPKRAVVGNMSVPYEILMPASEYHMNETPSPTQTQYTQPPNHGTGGQGPCNKFKVGDIITYTHETVGTVTARITQVNPKTYYLGRTVISRGMARIPTPEEETRFLQTPSANIREKTRNDFHVGQIVSFTHSKTGEVITGPILKLNPSRAQLTNHTVPYCMLS